MTAQPLRLLLATALMVLVCAPQARAASRTEAETRAQSVASRTVRAYGIHINAADFSVRCRRALASWSCRVDTAHHQCVGTLRLHRALKPYAVRIGCGE